MLTTREQASALITACYTAMGAPFWAKPPGPFTVDLARQILATAKTESGDRTLQYCKLVGTDPGWEDILAVMKAVIAATKP